MSGDKIYSTYDTLFSDLLNMGFEVDLIQHYISTCNQNNSEPILSEAVDFLLNPTPVLIKNSDHSLNLDDNVNSDIQNMEKRIPIVIGASKSITYPNSSLDLPSKPSNSSSPSKQTSYEENIRDKFSKKLKLEKEQEKRYRQDILQQIESDRKEANFHHPKFIPEADIIEIQRDKNDEELFTRISIRLLDGNIVVHYFNPMDTLDIVFTFLMETYNLSNILLVQSFPRKEYGPEDMKKFLLELGLGRSGSLIVKTMDDNSEIFGRSSSTKIDTQAPPPPNPQAPLLALSQNVHDWGNPGKNLGGDFIQKAAFLNKLESTKPSKKELSFSVYIAPLKELSFRILIQRSKANNFPSLASLSPLEGQMILARLIKEKMLTPKLVDKFMGCRMHTIDLTSCQHITNELLHRFNRLNSISTLIINGSPYLTDKAITFIVKLPNLESLILENCENLTNNSCFSIAKLCKLKHLNLRGSKISNKGVFHMIDSSSLDNVKYLNFSKTAVTEDILIRLGEHCNILKSLILESTKVKSLPNLGLNLYNIMFQLLTELDFSNCNFTYETNFSNFFKYLNLDVLKLYSVNITDFTFLQFLKLKSITLPRKFFNSNGSSPFEFLVGYGLVQLDLTNSLALSHDSLSYIGKMQTLSDLSLKNCRTCVSSDFHSLSSLTQLKKLDLEHTKITDDTSINIFPLLTQLTHLNLSGTLISDRFLRSRVLNSCLNLSMLNLNKTNVSNQGISCLSIPYLHTLFLNSTLVDLEVKGLLAKNCINLKLVAYNNLRELQRHETDEDSSSETD